jgi:hypothetical protein
VGPRTHPRRAGPTGRADAGLNYPLDQKSGDLEPVAAGERLGRHVGRLGQAQPRPPAVRAGLRGIPRHDEGAGRCRTGRVQPVTGEEGEEELVRDLQQPPARLPPYEKSTSSRDPRARRGASYRPPVGRRLSPTKPMSRTPHHPVPQAITQNRLSSGSARTMKSASSGYSQSTRRAPREIKRSTWAC